MSRRFQGLEKSVAVIVGQRPDHEAFEMLIGEPPAGAVEQLLAESQALVDRAEIELEDFSLKV